ncbi:MAG: SDR family oxidoreductase [Oscillospiraceae bacterium]|nr:SDR family oxidoreductase [Oscillospiraceae bacterium]
MNENRVCIITGGTSGIGRATALEMKEAGYAVYDLSRREEGNGITEHIVADVTREDTLISAVERIIEKEGHIDVLINNAGFGISGACEFTELEYAKKQLDVNFFGMVSMTKAVLPYMRKQGYGRIVSLSSVAAPIPIPFQAFYSASKAAINAYSLALANEVRPYGIQVCAVQPGDIHSGFTAAREKHHEGDEEYGGRIERGVKVMENDEINGMVPEDAAKVICRLATAKSIKPINTVGYKYKAFCTLVRFLPRKISNYLVGLIYSK